ncbi:MAG: trypsin-like peptidase domain-containing protein [Clostridia bacterium]|nr:trypsin-like peptidase domain-containing protein [Clostridia bacterium]
MKKTIGFLLTLSMSGLIAFGVSVVVNETTPSFPEPSYELTNVSAPSAGDIPAVSQRLTPSVVGISSNVNRHSLYSPSPGEAWSMGSGVIVSEDGYILTNHHVIADANSIYVTLHDGQSLTANRVWSDEFLDLAVIDIDSSSLPAAPLGDSSSAKVGESVIAIGNPLSLQFQRTVTSGIISATGRSVPLTAADGSEYYMENLLQTDASINPGNSGGPLINMAGEVIGINTVKVSSAEGIGFAIPSNLFKPVVERIIAEGGFITPYLGLFAYDKNTALYVKGSFESEQGIYVAETDPRGPAAKAGIKEGDIITRVGGTEINSMLELRQQLFTYKPGDTVSITLVTAAKKTETLSVRLSN